MLLRQGVLLTAIDSFNAVNPMMVGRTLERHQCIGPHQVRVMRHHPEDYLIQFEAPVHRDTLLGYGVLHVDGVPFLTKPWRPDKHAVIQRWMLHVRIVFERLPLDMWSLDGTEEVLGRFCRINCLDSHTHERRETHTFGYRV